MTIQEVKLRKTFSLDKDINWDLFTEEERVLLTECYHDGDYHNLTCLPEVAIDSPAREAEVDKMAISLRITTLDSESEVRQELNEFWADPANEMTPELEAEFQAKIDAELKEKREAIEPAEDTSICPHCNGEGCKACDASKQDNTTPEETTIDNKNEAEKLNIEASENKPLNNNEAKAEAKAPINH